MHPKLEYIKYYFLNNFEYVNYDWLHKEQTIQHPIHRGKQIVAYSTLHNIIKALKPKKIMEIGTWVFHSANVMALADDCVSRIDTYDIRSGGYAGDTSIKSRSNKIRPYIWRSYNTEYDKDWKYEYADIKDFKVMDNRDILNLNLALAETVCGLFSDPPEEKYDLIFIDGDHSYHGLLFDLRIAQKLLKPEGVIVIDNILDERLNDVNKVWNELKLQYPSRTYDFFDWNQLYNDRIIEMGIYIL